MTSKNGAALPKTGFHTVTPKLAMRWLERVPEKQRPLRLRRVRQIADDILAGLWEFTGQAIIFDCDGNLINGQHRLHACVLADTPIEVYVIHSQKIKPTAYDKIDNHGARSPADALHSAGLQYTSQTASAIRIQRRFRDGDQYPTTPRIKHIAVSDTSWNESAERVVKHTANLAGIAPISVVVWWYRHARKKAPGKADEFLDGLATGEGLRRGDPVLTLRNWCIRHRSDPARRLTQRAYMGAIVCAWNAYVKGQQLTRVFALGRSKDEVPMMEGEK